jgi:hypothetical protein
VGDVFDDELISRVETFRAAAEYLAFSDDFDGAQARRAKREFAENLPAVRLIAERVYSDLLSELSEVHGTAEVCAAAAGQLIGVLRDRNRVLNLLPPAGPTLAAAKLHERVWDVARHRWDDGHRLDAIRSAAAEVEQHLRAKVGIYDGDITRIVGESFNTKDPLPGQPRLRFSTSAPGSNDWTNAHEGASQFGRGVFMAIRNPLAHRNIEPEPQQALEYLAVLSVLARWIDDAHLETAP